MILKFTKITQSRWRTSTCHVLIPSLTAPTEGSWVMAETLLEVTVHLVLSIWEGRTMLLTPRCSSYDTVTSSEWTFKKNEYPFNFLTNGLNSTNICSRCWVLPLVLHLKTPVNLFLCLAISRQFFILFSLMHEASSSHSTKTLVILCGDQLALLVIVTGGTHRVPAPAVPEGNVPQEEMGCTRKCAVWQPLHQRKLAVYRSLKAGADFFA